MKQLILLFGVLYLIVSCETTPAKKQIDGNAYAEYFYPTDSLVPYVYVFQNVNQPLDEKVLRIYRAESASDTSLIVEFYNSDLKITEGYTHNLNDGFKVEDHMIVDGDGLKRQAKLSANDFFPKNKDDKTQFLSDFPSHLDSLTMIYQSKRRVLEENKTVSVLGKDLPALIIEDSVKILFVNPYTKESSGRSVMITRTFAKGYGMVRWSANNDEIVFDLVKILTNRWWEEVALEPQIRP